MEEVNTKVEQNQLSRKEIKRTCFNMLKTGAFSFIICLSLGGLINGIILCIRYYYFSYQYTLQELLLYKGSIISLIAIVQLLYAFKAAITKAYDVLFKEIIVGWIAPMADELTELIWKNKDNLRKGISKGFKKQQKEADTLDLQGKTWAWLHAKIYSLPPLVAKCLVFILNRTPIGDYVLYFDTTKVKHIKSKQELRQKIEEQLKLFFEEVLLNVFPAFMKYLIPINIVLLLAAFFVNVIH